MEFNIQRLFLVVQRKFLQSGRSYLFGIAIGTGVVLAITALNLISGQVDVNSFNNSALLTYFVGGVISTSLAFTEINKPETGYQFMTLPASSFEKFLASWFFTSIVYSLLAFIAAVFGSWLVSSVGVFGFTVQGSVVSLSDLWEVFKPYFVVNTIFLAGAAAFKRNAFFKTLLSILVLFAILGMYSGLLANIFGLSEIQGNNQGVFIDGNSLVNRFEFWKQNSAILVAFGTLLMLAVGFFKFKEREL